MFSRNGRKRTMRSCRTGRKKMSGKTQKTSIYVGLNDRETGAQKFDTQKYLDILKHVCGSYGVAFSFQTINGGFFHEDGRYTEENTLLLTLIDIEEALAIEIAKDLCAFFNQESVMVTTEPLSVVFVHEEV